jgi:two-component system, cell cycle sensor histidine kinase DivJ
MIGVMLDTTKLRAAGSQLILARDRAEAAKRSKSRLLANISHDLRTPLNAILGFSQIIDAEMFGAVGDQRYVSYAGDILDLSRIEENQTKLVIEPVNLAALVDQCIADIEIGAESNSTTNITSDISSDLPEIQTDGARLRQVLQNLIPTRRNTETPAGQYWSRSNEPAAPSFYA